MQAKNDSQSDFSRNSLFDSDGSENDDQESGTSSRRRTLVAGEVGPIQYVPVARFDILKEFIQRDKVLND